MTVPRCYVDIIAVDGRGRPLPYDGYVISVIRGFKSGRVKTLPSLSKKSLICHPEERM